MKSATTPTARSRGTWAEKLARSYLEDQGLELIDQNFHARGGEIDLIMRDANTITFIEVRYRASENYLSAVESIDYRKCQRIIKTSQYFLLSSAQSGNYNYRFDVITVTGTHQQPRIGWIKNAFEA